MCFAVSNDALREVADQAVELTAIERRLLGHARGSGYFLPEAVAPRDVLSPSETPVEKTQTLSFQWLLEVAF